MGKRARAPEGEDEEVVVEAAKPRRVGECAWCYTQNKAVDAHRVCAACDKRGPPPKNFVVYTSDDRGNYNFTHWRKRRANAKCPRITEETFPNEEDPEEAVPDEEDVAFRNAERVRREAIRRKMVELDNQNYYMPPPAPKPLPLPASDGTNVTWADWRNQRYLDMQRKEREAGQIPVEDLYAAMDAERTRCRIEREKKKALLDESTAGSSSSSSSSSATVPTVPVVPTPPVAARAIEVEEEEEETVAPVPAVAPPTVAPSTVAPPATSSSSTTTTTTMRPPNLLYENIVAYNTKTGERFGPFADVPTAAREMGKREGTIYSFIRGRQMKTRDGLIFFAEKNRREESAAMAEKALRGAPAIRLPGDPDDHPALPDDAYETRTDKSFSYRKKMERITARYEALGKLRAREAALEKIRSERERELPVYVRKESSLLTETVYPNRKAVVEAMRPLGISESKIYDALRGKAYMTRGRVTLPNGSVQVSEGYLFSHVPLKELMRSSEEWRQMDADVAATARAPAANFAATMKRMERHFEAKRRVQEAQKKMRGELYLTYTWTSDGYLKRVRCASCHEAMDITGLSKASIYDALRGGGLKKGWLIERVPDAVPEMSDAEIAENKTNIAKISHFFDIVRLSEERRKRK